MSFSWIKTSSLLRRLEVPALIAVPLVLLLMAYLQLEQSAMLTLLAVALCMLVFFASFEAEKPDLKTFMPIVVLSALAAAGRILFASIPSVQPVSAIVIISASVFGKRSGFMVGALAALVSNFFLGQGPWTPWQMYGWGLMGYVAGVLADKGVFKKTAVLYIYGFLAPILEYSLLLNLWTVVGFVHPLDINAVILTFAAAIGMDFAHAISTVVFLRLLHAPWVKKLARIQAKYNL